MNTNPVHALSYVTAINSIIFSIVSLFSISDVDIQAEAKSISADIGMRKQIAFRYEQN